jgi:hypothetical protein
MSCSILILIKFIIEATGHCAKVGNYFAIIITFLKYRPNVLETVLLQLALKDI